MFRDLARIGKYLGQTARLMVGVPDDSYVQHTRTVHPECKSMSYEEFFRERQAARFEGNRNGRCC